MLLHVKMLHTDYKLRQTFEFSLNVFTELKNIFTAVKGPKPATQPPLVQRPGCYHSTNKTNVRDRVLKMTPIHASVIYQIPLNSLNSVNSCSIQGKRHCIFLQTIKSFQAVKHPVCIEKQLLFDVSVATKNSLSILNVSEELIIKILQFQFR